MSVFDEVSEPASGSGGYDYGGYPANPAGQEYSHGDAYGSEQDSNTALWIGLAIGGALLLLVLGGFGIYFLMGDSADSETAQNSSISDADSNSGITSRKNPTPKPEPVKSSDEAKQATEIQKELAERRKKLDAIKKEREAKDAEEKRIRDEERRKRDAAYALERANGKADRAGVQREGESFEDWVTRSCQRTDHYYSKKFFVVLEGMEVVPEKLEHVSKSLCTYLEENESKNFDLVSAAMFKWRTTDTDQAIMNCVGSDDFGYTAQKDLMQALAKIGTPDAAEKLAIALSSTRLHHQVKPLLIAMGAMAEPAVMPYLDSETTSVRYTTYEIIEEIGTRESLELLMRNLKLEESRRYTTACQSAIDAINARHPEAADDQ